MRHWEDQSQKGAPMTRRGRGQEVWVALSCVIIGAILNFGILEILGIGGG